VRDGWIGKGVDGLCQISPDLELNNELNAAAAALPGSMKKVQTHLTSFRLYYESRQFVEDNLARGKA